MVNPQAFYLRLGIFLWCALAGAPKKNFGSKFKKERTQ
jgi:hypothetical protein